MSAYLLAVTVVGVVSLCSAQFRSAGEMKYNRKSVESLLDPENMERLLNKELRNPATKARMAEAIKAAKAEGYLDDSFDELTPLEQLQKLNELDGRVTSQDQEQKQKHEQSNSIDPKTRARMDDTIRAAKEAGYLDDSFDDLTPLEQMEKLTELEESMTNPSTSRDQQQNHEQRKSSIDNQATLGARSNNKAEAQQHVSGSGESDKERMKQESKAPAETAKKHHSEVKQDIQGLKQRVTDLEDRLDGDMLTALEDIVKRIEILDDHRETTHKILKKMKTSQNNHLHNCGPVPSKEGAIVTEGDGIATYECKPGFTQYGGRQTKSTCLRNGTWSADVDIDCFDLTTCQAMQKRGDENYRAVYAGNVNVTLSGWPCQRWIKRKPHDHFYKDIDFAETSGTGKRETRKSAANYCRDPGHFGLEHRVWCYIDSASKRWEVCDVKKCKEEKDD